MTILDPSVTENLAGSLPVRVFANDEVDNALVFIPMAHSFRNINEFKQYMCDQLPYNALSTRRRRANYLIERYYPEGHLETLLTYYAARVTSKVSLQTAIFLHILHAEPLAARIAEDFIYPALPIGHIDREELRAFILRQLPEIGPSTQKNVLRSVLTTYDHLGVGILKGKSLSFALRDGNTEGFLYTLLSQFSSPGNYAIQDVEQGIPHRWLLWAKPWLQQQLYILRDMGVISKVSEIDNLRQFTLSMTPIEALRLYFSKVQ